VEGLAIALVLFAASLSGRAWAWSVGTGATDPCHEEMSGDAYAAAPLPLDFDAIALPLDDTWAELAELALGQLGVDPKSMDEEERFVLVSLWAGVRAPDTRGHSAFDLTSLRIIHADPSVEGQYVHGTRRRQDDGAAGNAATLEGTRQLFLDRLERALVALERPPKERFRTTRIYMDFYGEVALRLWAPAYHLGHAVHTLQDTFSHAIRIESAGFTRIAHAMNYLEAIDGDLEESRDGLAHSDTFDMCREEEMQPVVAAAVRATEDLFGAFGDRASGADAAALESFVEDWMTLEPGCDIDNDYCGQTHWVELARKTATEPYVEGIFGCSTALPGWRDPSRAVGALLILMLLVACVRRRS